jgi:protein TBF1
MNSPGPVDNDPHDLASGFDLNAAIEEASRAAAQCALQPADEPPTFEDLSAFLTENVTRAVEQSRQAASNVELPSSIASAAESASRATALALESIARNQYHPTALPHSSSKTIL